MVRKMWLETQGSPDSGSEALPLPPLLALPNLCFCLKRCPQLVPIARLARGRDGKVKGSTRPRFFSSPPTVWPLNSSLKNRGIPESNQDGEGLRVEVRWKAQLTRGPAGPEAPEGPCSPGEPWRTEKSSSGAVKVTCPRPLPPQSFFEPSLSLSPIPHPH